MVGISFFLRPDIKDHIEDIWRMEIEPYLEEYFFDQSSKMDDLRWAKVKTKIIGD
jgi:5-methylcytosine-specific restriction protein B